jgi:hypothetical protein
MRNIEAFGVGGNLYFSPCQSIKPVSASSVPSSNSNMLIRAVGRRRPGSQCWLVVNIATAESMVGLRLLYSYTHVCLCNLDICSELLGFSSRDFRTRKRFHPVGHAVSFVESAASLLACQHPLGRGDDQLVAISESSLIACLPRPNHGGFTATFSDFRSEHASLEDTPGRLAACPSFQ